MGNIMRRKLRGNIKSCINLRREKVVAEKMLIASLGGKTRVYKRIVKETRKHSEEMRKQLTQKNKKKVEWLVNKYGEKDEMIDELNEDERAIYGECEILNKECEMKSEELRKPDVVCGVGETLEITENEMQVLALGPKFCVRKKLDETEFEVELEECIAKIKWDMMAQEEKVEKEKKEDIGYRNVMSILSEDEKEEVEEWEEIKDASRRMIFDQEDKKFNFGKKRATDLKGNTKVILPGMRKSFQDEANLEMLRAEMKGCF